MIKDLKFQSPDAVSLDPVKDMIELSPALYYLEANNYYLLKKEEAFKPNGVLGAKVLTYINDGLGLEVVLTWPAKVAQVLIVVPGGSQQIVAPMECLYENVTVLQAFLIDASRLRQGRFNHQNQLK
jgi:hypothetical protein